MEDFNPKAWASNAHLQSIFASLRWRALGKNPMVDRAQKVIFRADNDARLLGWHSPQPRGGKGLVLLIHGWEGSSDSTYMLCTGRYLFTRGYSILRLNLRDHGESHALNEGMFHSVLIEEVMDVCRQAAGLAEGRPYIIAGFSLGANFALRIALRYAADPIAGLRQIVSISPVLDPHKATLMIDGGSAIYRGYFLKKWKRSLRKKQALFPGKYDFTDLLKMKSCMEITRMIVPHYTPFRDHLEYFSHYTLLGPVFRDLKIPTLIITAEDDPVIDARDFFHLQGNGNLKVSIQKHGGHCGFLDPFPFGCWYEREIFKVLTALENSSP